MIRRIKIRNGFILENICGIELKEGLPMVGSKYCKKNCPFYRGEFRILWWNFIKCKR